MQHVQQSRVPIGGKTLEVARYGAGAGRPTIVLLHEALGSISHWREFPRQLADAAACNAVWYSRAGHGHSDGPVEKRGFDYMERQATTVLAGLLEALHIERPILFGHSEGAIISLFFAASLPGGVRGLILEAPVIEVEAATVHGMRRAAEAYRTAGLRSRLERHHRDADAVFRAFADPWLSEGTSAAGFEERLRRVECPALVLQGDRDEYSTIRQVEILTAHVSKAEYAVIPDCGHTPHREKTDVVLREAVGFLRRSGTI